MRKLAVCIWAMLLSVTCAYAQQILFRNYSVKNGLCSNTIWSICQDANGYMWFGTKSGLNRFDGYTFTTYQFREGDKQSLGDNFIHKILLYDEKTLWLGTEKGIYSYHQETGVFQQVSIAEKDCVFDMVKDQHGKVWIGTRASGLFSYDTATQQVQQFKRNDSGNSISLNQIRALAIDARNRLWIGTFGAGIDVLDLNSMQFRNRKGGTDLSNNRITSIFEDLKGNIWCGSLGGLQLWHGGGDSCRNYVKGGEGQLNENIVRAIYQPSPQKLYLGTEKGLNVLDLNTQQFTAYTNKSSDPYSISDNAVYAICPDKEGGIWLGTFFGGVNYFPEKGSGYELYYATGEPNALSGNAVSSFLEDRPGSFYVGTENGGLSYFDSHKRSFLRYPFKPGQQPLSYHNIHSLLKDDDGNIWIGTFSAGINILNPATGKVIAHKYNQADTTTISNNNVYALYKDKDGIIWVGTTGGLNRYNPATKSFIRIHEMGLQRSLIYGIYEDDHNNLWFLTYDHGLIGTNKHSKKWVQYLPTGKPGSISSEKLISLLDDGEGHLWLGTDGGGLNRFDMATKTFEVFGEKQGISATVYGILKANNGALWLSTNNGIIEFSPESKTARVFNNFDHLQSNQFNYNAALRASDGKMYFGGINGFNAFHPDSLLRVEHTSAIALTRFQLFNKDVVPGEEGGPLQKQIGFTNNIELGHDQSVLSFEYAAMSYLAPEKIQYAYQMQGFDRGWNYVGHQRKATYTNLPAGKYVFKVKSTDIYGNWKDATADMLVTVHPPFYQTPLAYGVYAILLVAAVYAARSIYISQLRKKNEVKLERLKRQKEHEFYEHKIEFFTTMAHEIRTPLSLITAPLEQLITQNDWSPQVKEQLARMEENSDRLLNLVNQLLDFRRIESDVYTIRKEPVELVSFVQALYARLSAMANQKGIRFSMSTAFNQLLVQADPEALTKILTNLLINSFKFAKTRVEIRINDLDAARSYFSISVIDDGKGIPPNQLPYIFQPFFKLNSNGDNIGGTGIGLALAKALSEKHDGRLTVDTSDTTQFMLILPMEEQTAPAPVDRVFDEQQPTIMVVEDDPALLDFISKTLWAQQFNVLTATNGVEALAVLEQHAPDLILSDVMMPEMDGIAFCHTVKNNINYSHIPLVLLTARGNSESEIAGIESGADSYIIKPFKWKHLMVVVKNLLESRAKLKLKFTQHPLADVGTLSTNSKDKEFLEHLIRIIEERITDPQLSVEELSKEMAMSRSSLHKKLKTMVGHVPNEFIRLIRLRNAAKILSSGAQSISEVGYLVGFNSHSYFSKCFLQQFGLTPREFAEKNHSKQNKIK